MDNSPGFNSLFSKTNVGTFPLSVGLCFGLFAGGLDVKKYCIYFITLVNKKIKIKYRSLVCSFSVFLSVRLSLPLSSEIPSTREQPEFRK